MLTRTITRFAFGVAAVLFGAAQTEAQPGKGGKGFGKGPEAGSGADVQKLERDLERLLEQIQDTKAKLARAKEAGKGKGGDRHEGQQGQFGGKGKKGFEGKKGFGGWRGFEGMKKEFGGKGGPGGKLDPATIKERYEYYKKLYDELPKAKAKGKGFEGYKSYKGYKGFERKKKEPTPEPKGKDGKGGKGGDAKGGPGGSGKGGPGGGLGGGAGGSPSTDARIDALIRELEALRNEIRGGKKK